MHIEEAVNKGCYNLLSINVLHRMLKGITKGKRTLAFYTRKLLPRKYFSGYTAFTTLQLLYRWKYVYFLNFMIYLIFMKVGSKAE